MQWAWSAPSYLTRGLRLAAAHKTSIAASKNVASFRRKFYAANLRAAILIRVVSVSWTRGLMLWSTNGRIEKTNALGLAVR